MFKKNLYLVILSVIISVCISCSKKPESSVDPKLMVSDIQIMQIDLGNGILKDLYDPEPFEQLKQNILDNKVTQEECVMELRKIISSYNIVHLNIYQQFSNELLPEYADLVFMHFDDGLRVGLGSTKYKKYMGWKVLEIGNLPVEEFLKIYNSYFSYETDSGRKYSIHQQPVDWKVLRHAGLLNKNGTLTLKIQSDEGQQKTIKCSSTKNISSSTLFSVKPNNITSSYMHSATNNTVELDRNQENRTFYFQFYGIGEDRINNYKQCLDSMMEELGSGAYDTVVFDLRYNAGGSINNLISYESQLYNYKDQLSNYNLAIAISGETYSAACKYVDYCVSIFPDIKIFGEESGQAISNYTMVIPETLKRLNANFIFPFEKDSMPALEQRAQDVTRGIIPDIEVKNTFDDFMNGRDAVYEAISQYYK